MPRDNKGRFISSNMSSQNPPSNLSSSPNSPTKHPTGPEITEKRPRSVEPQDQQHTSPSRSPLLKKNSSSHQVHQNSQGQDSTGNHAFYPQYMQHQNSQPTFSGKKDTQNFSSTHASHSSLEAAASSGAFPYQYFPSPQGLYMQGVNHQLQAFHQGNQLYNLPPQGQAGNGNLLVLANSQGLPISSVNLEDVMTRVMSGVMSKLESMSSDLKQVAVNKEATVKLKHELVQVKKDFAGVTDSVKELQEKEVQAAQNQQAIVQDLRDIKNRLDNPPPEGDKKQPSPETQLELLKLQAHSRKNNLIIEGLTESDADPVPEDEALEKVKTFFLDTFDLKDLSLDSAYRLGKLREGSKFPRPILVKFLWPRDRETVWKARLTLANDRESKVFIKEDLPPKLRAQMSALLKVAQVAKRYPNSFRNVIVKDFKIQVNGSSYSADQLESLPRKLRPSEFSTPGNTDAVVFYGSSSRFSNHYHSIFEWDRKSFSSMEQYLAFRRAKIAGRRDLANKAMNSDDPAESKRVMNELRSSPTEPKWLEERHDILYSGLLAKFAQRADLMNYLLESENRQLGEASRDKTWGIGLTLLDKNVLSPRHWQGGNLLGTTLMEVRQELSTPPRNEYQAPRDNNTAENPVPAGGT